MANRVVGQIDSPEQILRYLAQYPGDRIQGMAGFMSVGVPLAFGPLDTLDPTGSGRFEVVRRRQLPNGEAAWLGQFSSEGIRDPRILPSWEAWKGADFAIGSGPAAGDPATGAGKGAASLASAPQRRDRTFMFALAGIGLVVAILSLRK